MTGSIISGIVRFLYCRNKRVAGEADMCSDRKGEHGQQAGWKSRRKNNGNSTVFIHRACGAVNVQMVGDLLDRDGIAVAALDKVQRLLHIVRFLFIAQRALIRKFAREQIEVFIHNAVHHEIAVPRKLIGFKHFFMAAPQLIVRAVVDNELSGERRPLQISCNLNALHADPSVAPGGVAIRLIVDQLSGTDEKRIARI